MSFLQRSLKKSKSTAILKVHTLLNCQCYTPCPLLLFSTLLTYPLPQACVLFTSYPPFSSLLFLPRYHNVLFTFTTFKNKQKYFLRCFDRLMILHQIPIHVPIDYPHSFSIDMRRQTWITLCIPFMFKSCCIFLESCLCEYYRNHLHAFCVVFL